MIHRPTADRPEDEERIVLAELCGLRTHEASDARTSRIRQRARAALLRRVGPVPPKPVGRWRVVRRFRLFLLPGVRTS